MSMDTVSTSEPFLTTGAGITDKIARYWDRVTQPYEFFLGKHIHFGYVEDGERPSLDEATDHLIERLVEFGGLERDARVLDCGCGIGGTSFRLAGHYGARVSGVTLSPKQVELAREGARERGLDGVEFQVGDAHSLEQFDDRAFDTVWCVESCEQYYDKPLFLRQVRRVLRPGGKLIMATWCSSEEAYTGQEAAAYADFCRTFDCPYLPTIESYVGMLREEGFEAVDGQDWSTPVNRTWSLPPRRSSLREIVGGLVRSNSRFLRFAFRDVHQLKRSFLDGRVRYGVFRARKPQEG